MAVQKSKHFPLIALGDLQVTGSKQIVNPFPGYDVTCQVTLRASSAAEANKAVSCTAALDAAKSLITVCAWEATSSSDPTLIAATDEVTVDVLIVRQ